MSHLSNSETSRLLRDPLYQDALQGVLDHPLYDRIRDVADLRIFMEQHVFAVWDFMSLAKRLQAEFTGTTLPWLRPKNPRLARMMNEMILSEESDQDGVGGFASHLDLYLGAMVTIGADVGPFRCVEENLHAGHSVEQAISAAGLAETTRQFFCEHIQLALTGKTHQVAAAFCYGREDLIPKMFQCLLTHLMGHGQQVAQLTYYLQRHIELDGDQHGAYAAELLQTVCGECPVKWSEALIAAVRSLQLRAQLWDGVLEVCQTQGI